jgi:glycosyltransferase involved in cell wall biosynthesis
VSSQSSTIVADCPGTAVAASRLHVAIAYWDPYTPGGVQSQVAGRLDALGALEGPVRYTLFTKRSPPRSTPWPHIRTVEFSGWDWGSIAIAEYTAGQQLVRRLVETHRDDPLDLVELHASGFGPAVARWARRERIPCLFVSHSLRCFERRPPGLRWDARRYYAWANCRTANECSRVLAVSQALKNQWLELGIPSDRIEVQHTATDGHSPCAPGLSRKSAAVQLLYVGRISPEKGLDVLIDAVDLCMKRERLDIELTVVGMLSPREPLIESVKRRRLPITFAGAQTNATARAMMAQVDAVVIPSRYDACPLVAIEALQAGALVVASRVGGIPELIGDGETGLLVSPDDATELADVLCRIGRNRTAWASLRDGARDAGRRFTWSERGPQIVELYRRLVDGEA